MKYLSRARGESITLSKSFQVNSSSFYYTRNLSRELLNFKARIVSTSYTSLPSLLRKGDGAGGS